MTVADPTFDPTTGTWFLDTGEDAPTLRDLLAQLPDGAIIAGYHPCGYHVSSAARGYLVNAMRDHGLSACRKRVACEAAGLSRPPKFGQPSEPTRHVQRATKARRYDWDRVLDLWAAGVGSAEIAVRLAMPSYEAVVAVIGAARKQRDPRAMFKKDAGRVARAAA